MSSNTATSYEPKNYKFIILGQISVGKSSILQRYVKNHIPITPQTTIAIDCLMKNLQIEGKKYKIQLWDSAGHERYRTIVYSYYQHASGVAIVFDITNEQTLMEAGKWLQQTKVHCAENIPIILLANKCDQMNQNELQRKLKELELIIQQYKEEYGCSFFTVSALNGEGVEQSFRQLIRKADRQTHRSALTKTIHLNSEMSLSLLSHRDKKQKQKSCC